MPPDVALLVWLILLLALLAFDPARARDISAALWIPVIWVFFVASRLPSQWLGGTTGTVATVLEEGNPLDRSIDLVLITLAIGILMSRSFNWGGFFTKNLALMAFLAFALVSVVWSDYPFVAFKRWFRDFGNYLMILVVLTDPQPLEAVRAVLRRLTYLLVPLSITLIKYFPELSKQYDTWTGAAMFCGATTSKNMLGVLCLISGIFYFWDTVTRWPERKQQRTKRILLVNYAFIVMTLWLLNLSNSATSRVGLAIGCMVILVVHSKLFQRHSGFVKIVIPMAFLAYVIVAFGLDLNGSFAAALGRDPTLTDRTLIWQAVLSAKTNPIIGTGYESFWLGPRLWIVWKVLPGINEAHNGYLDMYANLGYIGVGLLFLFLIASYRKIWQTFSKSLSVGSLGLAVWTILLFYNVTEAAFKSGLLWLTLLLAAIAVPERTITLAPSLAEVSGVAAKGFSESPLETVGRQYSR
jgi:exopolysaccharide production protein ExoQ